MMSKGIVCYGCKKEISLFDGLLYDQNLSLICCFCMKPILGTTEDSEKQIVKIVSLPSYTKKEPLAIRRIGADEEIPTAEISETRQPHTYAHGGLYPGFA